MFNSTVGSIKSRLQILLIAAFSTLVIGCTDSVSDTAIISGTAATGAAIDGEIWVYGSAGDSRSFSIDVSGHYVGDVSGLETPFLVVAKPTDETLSWQYSYASQADITVNVTSQSSLTLFLANGGEQDLSLLVDEWTNPATRFTQLDVDAARAIVQTNFEAEITDEGLDPAVFDLFSTPFNADGTGFDAVLDRVVIEFSVDANTSSFTITLDGSPFGFDLNIDLSGWFWF